MPTSKAWYENDRASFVAESLDVVVGKLASAASKQGLHLEDDQHVEWESSVGLLQCELADVDLLRATLMSPLLSDFQHVILEYDFRRRGLRMDCVLLGKGIIAVVEFKRSRITGADRDQVTNYCINLVEFHEDTRRACTEDDCIVAPVLALTQGNADTVVDRRPTFHNQPWGSVVRMPFVGDRTTLHDALRAALDARRSDRPIGRAQWLTARFAPSSTILDAAISLYGKHDVTAIAAHASPIKLIEQCTAEVAERILLSKADKRNRIIFVSGAPGAGKTLVGLKLAFDPRFQSDAVFVTGNTPLVDVLEAALKHSYTARRKASGAVPILTGYEREDARRVVANATFKIVKAHAFLGARGSVIAATDGSVVIFDEAQRTYEKGREVLGKKLEDNEADLILDALEKTHGVGNVVVALVGDNQAINRGELGIAAWFAAAESRNWLCAISDETLALSEIASAEPRARPTNWERLQIGHLPHSLRYYRNGGLESWAGLVLADDAVEAARLAKRLDESLDTVWLVRDIREAKAWVNQRRVGDERAGIIASGQAKRLSAEGLFVELKPDIAKWMLAPSGDIRSSNMLETVQNQYQIQGLEIDYSIVCWDADLRRSKDGWDSYKISGAVWRHDKALEIAKNGYRVLLTRARKGMMIFIPRGDATGTDPTRTAAFYDEIAGYLLLCGARNYISESTDNSQSV